MTRPRRSITGFVDEATLTWRELRDPDGPPTTRQLVALFRAGALELVEPDPAPRFTKGEAAFVIDQAVAAGLLERGPVERPDERYDRVCRAIVDHVRAHPGCTTSSVIAGVTGAKAYVGERVRDLLELGVLENRARRQGRRRARELWHVNNDAAEERQEGDE